MEPDISLHLDRTLTAALTERKAQSRYRVRRTLGSAQGAEVWVDGCRLVNFCSNDYLGLANHPELRQAAVEVTNRFGTGSGASHLVCGHSDQHHRLEEELAAFTGRQRALVFSTGYMANMGCITALLGRADGIFQDKLNHASLLDAGLLSRAKFQRFNHQDLAQLETHLDTSTASRKLIATDGVFSMDGDIASLPQLAQLAAKHKAWLMVDDAHGLGCLGPQGAGSVAAAGLSVEEVPILMGTLGKAVGSFGAFIAGSEILIETLIQFARPYIYTTALPPAVAAASRAGLRLIQQEPERRQHLMLLINHFQQLVQQTGLPFLTSITAIQPLITGTDLIAIQLQQKLTEKGFWVSAIRPPTVPEGSARLRFTLTASHTQAQIDSLFAALQESWQELHR